MGGRPQSLGWGGRGKGGAKDKASRGGRVRWARASTGRCVRTGGLGSGVRQLRGITFGWSFVQRDLWGGVWRPEALHRGERAAKSCSCWVDRGGRAHQAKGSHPLLGRG